MKKIIYTLFAAALLAGFVSSCVEAPTYEPAPKPTNEQVYFPTTTPTTFDLKGDETTFSIVLCRGVENLSGALVVALDTADDSLGMFHVPAAAVFEDQCDTAKIVIVYDPDKMATNEYYPLTISIAHEDALGTLYAPSFISIKAGVALPWLKFDVIATCQQSWWDEGFTDQDGEERAILWYQDLGDGTKNFKVENMWNCDGYSDFTFLLHSDTNLIDVDKQYLGVDYDDFEPKPEGDCGNPIYVYDWYHFYNIDSAQAGSWDTPYDFYSRNGASFPQSYYDGNGGFFFNLRYYIPGVGGWTPDKFDVQIICKNFVRKDFTLEAEYKGMFVDPEMNASPILTFTAGENVSGIKYAVALQEEADLDAMYEAIFSEEDLEYVSTATLTPGAASDVQLALEPGLYTILAVVIDDEGGLQEEHYAVLDFYFSGIQTEIPELDATLQLVDPTLLFDEATCEANNITTYNAIGYVIEGTNIKSVTTYLNTTAIIAGSGFEPEYICENYGSAMSESAIAKINTQGYYASAFIKLDSETEYMMIAIVEDKLGARGVLTATYTTDVMPYDGELVIGDYAMVCGEGDDMCANVFTVKYSGEGNGYFVTNLAVANGATWYAEYDPQALTLTLNGVELGYEKYENQFGDAYGYYDQAQTMYYSFLVFNSDESEGDDPCIFAVDPQTKEVCSLESEIIVAVFLDSNDQYLGDMAYFEAGTACFLYTEEEGDSVASKPAMSKSIKTLEAATDLPYGRQAKKGSSKNDRPVPASPVFLD